MRALMSDARGSVDLVEIEEPETLPNEVLVEVDAVSINRGETFLLEAPPPHWRPGKDFAGTVAQSAKDGHGPQRGTRVVGHGPHSCWAERVAVAADRIVALPNSITTTTAAALPLAGLTALRLARLTRLSPDTRVLMTGASGGVGHFLAELAHAASAPLTTVVGSDERGATLREFGATTILDIAAAEGRFDVGLDSVGGDSLAQVRRRIDPAGRVIWFGQASRSPAFLDFFDWVDGTTGAPITQFDYTVSDRSLQRDLTTLVELTAKGRLHPVLGSIRGVTESVAAIDDLRHRRITGNLVVKWT